MSDVAIRAVDLRKVYRLYTNPTYRFLDMFGLLRSKPGQFTEHVALAGVNVEIHRGEKVAIIGRNGAGKSTFLKLVTGVIEPTSGSLAVSGTAHALLQIGTGFHPDFTGRENVYAYFAQLGLTGAEARRRCDDVVEFAEIEEYIDQPMKTYSTGMTVRLMFSASTAITPDLLVLDEVLGVGDAYFAHKSYERIRTLCERDGTTLLLVTHDIYSAVNLCGRAVWIDRGRVLMDGASKNVVKGYEDSVRQQEENRLRLRKQERASSLQAAPAESKPSTPLLVEVYAQENRPQPSPVYFSAVTLGSADGHAAELPLDERAFDERRGSHLQQEGTCWGPVLDWQGRRARPMLNYGSPFHKIAGVFETGSLDLTRPDMALSLQYWSAEAAALELRVFIGRQELSLGPLPGSRGEWTRHVVRLQDALPQAASTGEVNTSGRHGTGAIVVDEVRSTLDGGEESHTFDHGSPANILIAYRINQPDLCEHSQVLLAFHRDGVLDTCRTISRDLLFDTAQARRGTIRVRLPRLGLANGTYTVTVMVAREGYYDREQTRYFSLNPEVYTCLSRAIEIVVRGAGIVGTGTGVVVDAEWGLGDPASPSIAP
ncbi:MAG: hypothetical protein JWL71_4125 [Acidobacteria bacterium]|nr:hypothetical protein [Acidobacteriota bacterium]